MSKQSLWNSNKENDFWSSLTRALNFRWRLMVEIMRVGRQVWTLKVEGQPIIKKAGNPLSDKAPLTDKECMNLILGALKVCMTNRDLAYISSVGAEYSHLNSDGEKMLLQTLKIIFPKIVANENKRVEDLMHERLLKELK